MVERLNGGRPILAPSDLWWENSVTHNTAALYLKRSAANEALIAGLLGVEGFGDLCSKDGVVVLHYRARPREDPGYPWSRSFVGLAVLTPEFEILRRYDTPVLAPDENPDAYDYLGVEDPRITPLEDGFCMVYCGVARHPVHDWRAQVCLAWSRDLLHWEKLGPIAGEVNAANNKDGVLFPGKVRGRHLLLHRPMVGEPQDFAIALAASDALGGPWVNCGDLFRAQPNPAFVASWVGAGSVPIALGEDRFVEIYHTGNRLASGGVEYDLDAALLDLSAFDGTSTASAAVRRLEHLMAPETPQELGRTSEQGVSNVLFICGSYEREGWIYLIYGGADSLVFAARVGAEALLAALERSPRERAL